MGQVPVVQTRRGTLAAVGWLLVLVWVFPALAGNTYINDIPNQSVSEPDCYSFDIYVDQASGSSATLTLRVNDVDEEAGELDEVYLNGTYLGYLSGTNDMWSTTSFNVSSVVNYGANNTVRICIDPDGGESSTWVAEIDWGQILVDGGSAEDADILSVSASGTWNAIQVTTSVQATNTDTFRLEINLLDSTGNNKDISVDTFNMTGGSSTSRITTVNLPSEPTATETFTLEANLFNNTTGIQQSVKSTTWTYTASEPPTDILLSSNQIDENLSSSARIGTLTATDADSASHTFTLIGGESGSFSISGDELRAATAFDYESQASYSIQVQAEDTDGNTTSKWITILITDINESPVIEQGEIVSVSMDEDGFPIPFSLTLTASDPDGDTVSWSVESPASLGSASVSGDGLSKTISYIPDTNAHGSDSFSVRIHDGNGAEDSILVNVTVNPVNDPPSAAPDTDSVQEAGSQLIDVLSNDTDVEPDTLHVLSVTAPSQGSATIQPDDAILYQPDPDACGNDTFSYTVSDGNGGSDTATVTVTIINIPPTASGDRTETLEEAPVLISVLDNDTDPSGLLLIESVDSPSHGTARILGSQIEYSPQVRFEGRDTFSYTIIDPCGATAIASVDVEVVHLNHPPTANAGGFLQGTTGEPIELNASGSSDPDTGDRLEYRWDVDGDGRFDTGWLRDPVTTTVYQNAFTGQVTLEVRDLYQGLPTGEVSQATALVRIGSVQSITVWVFEDTDGDSERSDGEPGVPGIDILLQGSEITTGDDGSVTLGVEAGSWSLSLAPEAIEYLLDRDCEVLVSEVTVDVTAGGEAEAAFVVRKTAGRLQGIVYMDVNENEEFDEEDTLVPGLEILLDENEDPIALTDDEGAFLLRRLPFGEHTLLLRETGSGEGAESTEETPSLLLPIAHSADSGSDLLIRWPWAASESTSGSGFLQVKVGAEKND